MGMRKTRYCPNFVCVDYEYIVFKSGACVYALFCYWQDQSNQDLCKRFTHVAIDDGYTATPSSIHHDRLLQLQHARFKEMTTDNYSH